MSRVRAHSGGHGGVMSPSKSWAELSQKGFGMTASTPAEGRSPMSRSPEDESAQAPRRRVSDTPQVGENDGNESWESESGTYDNRWVESMESANLVLVSTTAGKPRRAKYRRQDRL